MRIVQKTGLRGSLKWIQLLVNDLPGIFSQKIGASDIDWLSPLKDDDPAEYRDSDFLKVLNLEHLQQDRLEDYWSNSGPQWDALGKSRCKYSLVEVKVNIPEIYSTCKAKNPRSVSKIEQAISESKKFYSIENGEGWLAGYYQYANRLSHLFFLREVSGVDAELLFVYFCDDPTNISTSIEDWSAALAHQKKSMGIGKIDHVNELFF